MFRFVAYQFNSTYRVVRMLKLNIFTVPILAFCLLNCQLKASDPAQEPQPSSSQVACTDSVIGFSILEDEHGVTVKVNGEPFASYIVDEINKPYLWPIIGATGKPMTRAFPMKSLPTESKEQRDHPHHRGITFGHESIVGTNNDGGDTWHERKTFEDRGKNPNLAVEAKQRMSKLATIKHREFTELVADTDHAEIVAICDFLDSDGKQILTERRRMTFQMQSNSRSIDVDQDFTATDGEVRFNDRKDAGLSIRVPASMAVDSGEGGQIINSNGEADNDAWSRAAKWVDYHGPADGEHLGIAFLNHPSSYRFPTRWHVRSYGLFTANPFASQSFDPSLDDGTSILKSGEQLKLRHRIIFHTGDADSAEIEEQWQKYSKEER
jgi:hypothetical protein